MNSYVYLEKFENILLEKLFKTEVLLIRRNCKNKKFKAMFLNKQQLYSSTIMKFPNKSEKGNEAKVQKQNYDYFIHTMAELIKKYIVEI